MFWMIILGIIIKGDVPLNHDGEGLFYEIKYRESEGSFEWDRERLSNFLDRLKEIGIKYYRLHLRWDVVQPDSLIYDFSFYDTLISNLKRRGIEPFITFQGCPWWASKANDPIANPRARKAFDRYAPKREYYDEFKRFLKKVLEHYSSQNTPENIKVRYYEHFNEPEAFWRRNILNVREFTPIEIITDTLLDSLIYPVFDSFNKDNYPDTVVVIATHAVQLNSPFIEREAKVIGSIKGHDVDIVSVHAYHKNVENWITFIENMKNLMADSGVREPLWVTEYGLWTNYTNPEGKPPDSQAFFFLKTADYADEDTVLEKIFQWTTIDVGAGELGGTPSWGEPGIIRNLKFSQPWDPYVPKPSYFAWKSYSETYLPLKGKTVSGPQRSIKFSKGRIHIVYEEKGDVFYTYSLSGGETFEYPVNVSEGIVNNSVNESSSFSVFVEGDTIFIAFKKSFNSDIYLWVNIFNSNTGPLRVKVSEAGDNENPYVLLKGDTLYVLWVEKGTGNDIIKERKYSISGFYVSPVISIYSAPSIEKVALCFVDGIKNYIFKSGGKIYRKFGNTVEEISTGTVNNFDVKEEEGKIFLVYEDNDGKIYYRIITQNSISEPVLTGNSTDGKGRPVIVSPNIVVYSKPVEWGENLKGRKIIYSINTGAEWIDTLEFSDFKYFYSFNPQADLMGDSLICLWTSYSQEDSSDLPSLRFYSKPVGSFISISYPVNDTIFTGFSPDSLLISWSGYRISRVETVYVSFNNGFTWQIEGVNLPSSGRIKDGVPLNEGEGKVKIVARKSNGDKIIKESSFYVKPRYSVDFEQGSPYPYFEIVEKSSNIVDAEADVVAPPEFHGLNRVYAIYGRYTSSTDTTKLFFKVYPVRFPLWKKTYISYKVYVKNANPEYSAFLVDGITKSGKKIRLWKNRGYILDQTGKMVRYTGVPYPHERLETGKWYKFIYSLAPMKGETLITFTFGFEPGIVRESGEFIVYLDSLEFIPYDEFKLNYPVKGIWYAKEFPDDYNAYIAFESLDTNSTNPRYYGGVRLIMDMGGGSETEWTKGEVNKDLAESFRTFPRQYIIKWSQRDKAHTLYLALDFYPYGTDIFFPGSRKRLIYGANAPNKWDDLGWVSMGKDTTVYNEWETFVRGLSQDFNEEYGEFPDDYAIYSISVGHLGEKDWTGDKGGTVKDIEILYDGFTPQIFSLETYPMNYAELGDTLKINCILKDNIGIRDFRINYTKINDTSFIYYDSLIPFRTQVVDTYLYFNILFNNLKLVDTFDKNLISGFVILLNSLTGLKRIIMFILLFPIILIRELAL